MVEVGLASYWVSNKNIVSIGKKGEDGDERRTGVGGGGRRYYIC